jgi:hypothetical protein
MPVETSVLDQKMCERVARIFWRSCSALAILGLSLDEAGLKEMRSGGLQGQEMELVKKVLQGFCRHGVDY